MTSQNPLPRLFILLLPLLQGLHLPSRSTWLLLRLGEVARGDYRPLQDSNQLDFFTLLLPLLQAIHWPSSAGSNRFHFRSGESARGGGRPLHDSNCLGFFIPSLSNTSHIWALQDCHFHICLAFPFNIEGTLRRREDNFGRWDTEVDCVWEDWHIICHMMMVWVILQPEVL